MIEFRYLYFGCGPKEAGHYLFDQNGMKFDREPWRSHLQLDGTLAPWPEKDLYVASVNRLPGIGYTAVAWWDRSQDQRPASNSIFWAPLKIHEKVIVEYFEHLFPWAAKRLPQKLELMAPDPCEARSCERCGLLWAGRFPQTVCPPCLKAAAEQRPATTDARLESDGVERDG